VTERVSAPPPASDPELVPSPAARLARYQRAGGVVTPVLTAFVAFLVGGIVVVATTGKNPFSTYRAIFDGAGLNWFFKVDHHSIGVPFTSSHVWFPWDTSNLSQSGFNLQQTLILTTSLILTGLAVAFAFRCGLFNIGGNGQYTVGSIVGVQVGIWLAGWPRPAHVVLALGAAIVAGALWAGIAGFLKATVGAHEVITTIMLNWIALWIGSYLIGFNGPMQQKLPGQESVPQTADVAASAKLPVFWGSSTLQGLHIGLFVAIGALVLYWLVLNRTTLGFEVRAVGYNAEAARYSGISVRRSYFLAMAISGAFAGLAGGIDVLGWEFHLDLTVVQTVQLGFIGIAVALLGRNGAIGVFLSALLFAALLNGTSTRNLDPSIFRPELAGNLARIIQGLVVLFVGADVLILYLWSVRRKLRRSRAQGEAAS
jgi:simple sugar transport system permease protein